MAIARNRIYDRTKPVTCHCVSRCVRRMPLLAAEERRRALRDRLAQLVRFFAIDVLEWALLANHFHLVAASHPDLARLWTDEEVARRWRTLSPDYAWRRANRIDKTQPAQPEEIEEALRDPELIARWRGDLADLSIFHKFLKQKLARVINVQEDVTGHCFEGRFKSIVALDEEAVIAHMVYVALNPIRASMADTLGAYEFCSIADRVGELKRRIDAGEFAGEAESARRKLRAVVLRPALPCDPGEHARKAKNLADGRRNPWFGGRTPSLLHGSGSIGLVSFLAQVDSVGRIRRAGKPGAIAATTPTPLAEIERLLGRSSSTPGDRFSSGTTRQLIDDVESAMARGLASPIGNFSGSAASLARVACETGRRFIVAVATMLPGGRRRVSAEVSESSVE